MNLITDGLATTWDGLAIAASDTLALDSIGDGLIITTVVMFASSWVAALGWDSNRPTGDGPILTERERQV